MRYGTMCNTDNVPAVKERGQLFFDPLLLLLYILQERWLLRSSSSVLMEQKSACHLSHVLNSAHRQLTLENSKAAAVRERREGLEEDEEQVGACFFINFFNLCESDFHCHDAIWHVLNHHWLTYKPKTSHYTLQYNKCCPLRFEDSDLKTPTFLAASCYTELYRSNNTACCKLYRPSLKMTTDCGAI